MNVYRNFSIYEKIFWQMKTLQHRVLQSRLATRETAIVDTEFGKVRGLKRNTVYEDSYYSFEGIPYARPPVGSLRFKAPECPNSWVGIRDCTKHKEKATQVQFVYNQVEGSEDCLYLNVYTNKLCVPEESRRPVLVFIHGGGFILGEANRDWYGPDYFMKQDIVLVTIQYRLGVLGFLSLEDPTLNVPGNAGLKDQVFALKWVKKNCGNFGGNSDCITVFGESAGAASTHYMMLTKQTQDIFHRAILMSGNALCPWALTDCRKRAYTMAKLVGYKGPNEELEIFKFLQKADAADLARMEGKALSKEDLQNKVMFAFGPTVEPYDSPQCVLPQHPRELAKTAWSNKIPIMMGNTSFEGLLALPETKQCPEIVKELDSCYNYVPREVADIIHNYDEIKSLGMKLRRAHVSGNEPTAEEYMDFCSQFWFWFPTHRLIHSRFVNAPYAPMYLYRFDYDSEVLITPFRIMRYGRGVRGVSHADDLAYLFWNSHHSERLSGRSRDYMTVQTMVGIWSHFAATGNPCNKNISGLERIKWEPLDPKDEVHQCLNVSDELEFIDLPEIKKIKAFESCYDCCRELHH